MNRRIRNVMFLNQRRYQGPLDLLGLATQPTWAFSMARRLRAGYTGNAIRAKITTGGAEAEYGYLANGDFDVTTLDTAIGASSATVVTAFDQMGSVNPTQATEALQPTIATSGTVNVRGTLNRPLMSAVNDKRLKSASNITLETGKRFTTILVYYFPSTGGGQPYRQWFGQYAAANFHHITARSGTTFKHLDFVGTIRNASLAPTNTLAIEAIVRTGDTTFDHWEDGAITTAGVTMNTGARGAAPLSLFGLDTVTTDGAFEIAEILHFNADIGSTDIYNIMSNMATYYNVTIAPP